jgi:ankyrin repeat protein
VNQHIPLLQLVIERCKSKHPSLDFFNIPLFNHGGLYPLHVCVQSGNMQIMELLLQVCDPGKRDDEGCDVFHHAAESGNEDIWSVLFRRYVECDFYEDNASRTILHHAASGGNTNTVLFVISAIQKTIRKVGYGYTMAADPYFVLDFSGRNFLHIAALKGHYDIVLSCLDSAAHFKRNKEFELETPHVGSISIFMAMCAADRSELTPIHHAVQRGDYQMAKTFFEFSNIQGNPVSEWLSESGKTKLIWLASVAGASDILRLLNAENIGIDMSLTSVPFDLDILPGMLALEHAIRTKNATASKALLEAGASVGKLTPNYENGDENWTLLMSAVASGSTNIVLQLMEYETFSIDDEPSEDSVISVRWIVKALNLAVRRDFRDISELLVSGVMSRILAGYPPRTLSRAGGHASMHIRLDVTWVAMILHEPSAWITGARYYHKEYYLASNRVEGIRKYQPGFSWLHSNDRLDGHSGYALWHDKLFYLPPSSKATPPFRNPRFFSVDIDFTVEHFGFTLLFGETLWPGTTKSRHYFMTRGRPGLLADIEILDRFWEMEGVSSGFESAAICVCKTSDTFGDIHWESRDMRFTRSGTREC